MYFLSSCWDDRQSCSAYGRFAEVVAYVLAGPVFFVNRFAIGVADSPFGTGWFPLVGPCWIAWLLLWAYYYLVLALLFALFRALRTRIGVRNTR